jgi:CBS domain-containing protein/anti-sigma regulatory factor (Ser/Thr protein kinase)
MAAEEVTKLQELIYTTRVETVMARDVIVIDPSMTMERVKDLLRKRRISGAPVVDNRQILGVVGMSDVIAAMERGDLKGPVTERMTTKVKTVSVDASVLEAVQHLGREGFNRLPVVDREGLLVGIVTNGVIMGSLLKEMEISFKKKEAEKLPSYRASYIFKDILSDNTSVVLRYVVADKDFNSAGHASSMIKKSLQRIGAPPSIVRRVAVAVYEAEMNLVIHTDVGGRIIAEIMSNTINISAVDHGPGIEDISKVLQPGYSTAPEWIRDMGFGAGMGLANINRCSDMMQIISQPGGSTRLDMVFKLVV